MFTQARIQLTVWYLVIIMAISLSFSGVIYIGINNELGRLDNMQKARQDRVDRISTFLEQNGLPIPPEPASPNTESVSEARGRIIIILGLINLSILVLSGAGGYFLAGQTLEPIAQMLDEQKEFVGNASHELRTPLTSLKTEIEVSLRDKKLSLTQAKQLLASNLEDVNMMQKLSNYLLELHKYENGKAKLTIQKIDLVTVGKNSLKKLEALAKERNIKLVDKLKSAKVSGDEDSLIELVSILIDNAIKYSSKGKQVIVKSGVEKGRSFISVQDFGIGIAQEDLGHLFERFYRADNSRSKVKTDGYGLGLSIAKSIVDLHKGRISVESKIGKGTTFTVQL